ncbi:MAG TPA: ABC transporter transmembrane domain-containing protein [Abditibacteriaceae bacterium]|jgi:ATP-binding cassette subfamily B protein
MAQVLESPDKSTEPQLPVAVQTRLNELGVNGDARVRVQSDLDERGNWGARYLVATSQRVVVLSAPISTVEKRNDTANSADVSVELDVPLAQLKNIETRAFIGASALEARVQNGDELPRVVELLRSSNAHSRDLNEAARQLKVLQEDENAPLPEPSEEKKICPNCARPLPNDTQVCPFCVNRLQALRRLFNYLGPYKWLAIGNGILSILGTAMSFVPAVAFAYLVDHVLNAREGATGTSSFGPLDSADSRQKLAVVVGVIVVASLFSAIINITRGRWAAYLGAGVLHDIRAGVYSHLQHLSLAYYDKREVGAVMSRVQNDVGMLQNFLLDGAENIIVATLTIIGVIIVMMTRSWQLALVVLIPVPFVILGTTTYWRGLMKLWRRVWRQNSSLGARLADSLNGVRVVRAFAQEEGEVGKFQTKSAELRDATMRVERKAAVFYPALGFIMGLGGPLTWYVGGRQVLDGTLTYGGLTLFTVLLTRLYEPIQQLTRLINFMTRAMTAAERVFEILDTDPDIKEKQGATAMPYVEGRVEFRDVIFGYDKYRPILHGVSLEVNPGEMVGLVGHSGAGKSTLINLLMRFYDVDNGALLIDGVDIRDVKRDDLRSQVGVVLQEPYLFHGSVWSNITYAKPDATPAEVIAAAKAAYAHDFIVGFPDGYDTVVGERGTRLSGGERQRISIARAILHNPRILILDEATASVDTQTEQQIQKALKNLVKGRTVFAIAHRLSTLRDADRLVVLEHGKIAEIGTHDELMQKHGTFYKLVEAQQQMNAVLTVGG